MDTPTKVIIEITAEGYSTTVFNGEEVIAKKESVMKSAGHAVAKQKLDWYDHFYGPLEPMAEALEDISAFEIASELFKIAENQD